MSDTFQPIHPRRLHATLLAATSHAERAQATLDFLCKCTGSARGYLFLNRATGPNGLKPAAHSGQGAAPPDVTAEAERVWLDEFDAKPDDSRTRTVDLSVRQRVEAPPEDELWQSATGTSYTRGVLGIYRKQRWVPVGIVLLEASSAVAPLRHAYIEAVCNAFIDSGEVPGAGEESGPKP